MRPIGVIIFLAGLLAVLFVVHEEAAAQAEGIQIDMPVSQ